MSAPDNNTSQRNQNYRTCIPFYILYDLDLNANHLRLYGQIEQLESNPNPNVRASFSYDWMAKQLGIDRRNVIRIAQLLKTKGYITHSQLANGRWVWGTKKVNIIDEQSEEGGVILGATPGVILGATPGVILGATQNTQKINTQNIKEDIDAHAGKNPEPGKIVTRIYLDTYYNEILTHPDTYQPTQDESDESFELFWDEYPVKKSRNLARNMWHAQKCNNRAYMIIEKLIKQKSEDCQFIDGFAPNPTKYIGEEKWNDEIQKRPKRQAFGKPVLDHNCDKWARNIEKDFL